jgi:hypothetical protein
MCQCDFSVIMAIIYNSRRQQCTYDRLIHYLLFYVPLMTFSLIWRRHHYRWRAAEFLPIVGAQVLCLYRATSALTRCLGFSGLIRRTALFNRSLQLARGYRGPILTRILTAPHSVAFYHMQGLPRTYSNPDPHRLHLWKQIQLYVVAERWQWFGVQGYAQIVAGDNLGMATIWGVT